MAYDPMPTAIAKIERDIDRIEAQCDNRNEIMSLEVANLKEDFAEMKGMISERVPLSRYLLVERIVFAEIALVTIAVFTAIISLVVRTGGGVS